MTYDFFLLSSFALACFLSGLIWVVQVIHYPAYHFIDQEKFTSYAVFHASRISLVVAPMMIFELVIAILWVSFLPSTLAWFNFLTIIIIWGITFFISMPCHKILSIKKDELTIDRLVNTNWFRTIVWTLRGVILGYYLFVGR